MRIPAPLLFAAAFVLVLYAGLALFLPADVGATALEAIRWVQVDTLLASRGTSLAAALPGVDLDPEGEFLPPGIVSSTGGRLAEIPSLLPLLAGPFALLFGRRGGLVITGAAVILCLAAVTRLTRLTWGADPRMAGQAALASMGGVLATPLLGGGALFEDHGLAALACAVAAIPLVKRAADLDREAGEPARLWFAGIAAGMVAGSAAWFAAQTLLFLPVMILAGAVIWGRRFLRSLVVPLLVGAILPVAALAGWSVLTRGRPGPLRLPPIAQVYDFALALPPRLVLALGLSALALHPRVRSYLRRRLRPVALGALALTLGAAILLASFPSSLPIIALLPVALLPRNASMPKAARFLGLSGALFILMSALMGPAVLEQREQVLWPALMGGAPLLAIYLVGLVPTPVGPRASRMSDLIVIGVIGFGVITQLAGLRRLAGLRLDRAALAARVEAGTPDGAVLLTDSEPLSLLLASQRGAPPVFLARPGQDAAVLLGRIDEARMEAVWIRASKGEDAGQSNRRQPGDASIDLGSGLVLVRGEAGAGTRGFTQVPEGD